MCYKNNCSQSTEVNRNGRKRTKHLSSSKADRSSRPAAGAIRSASRSVSVPPSANRSVYSTRSAARTVSDSRTTEALSQMLLSQVQLMVELFGEKEELASRLSALEQQIGNASVRADASPGIPSVDNPDGKPRTIECNLNSSAVSVLSMGTMDYHNRSAAMSQQCRVPALQEESSDSESMESNGVENDEDDDGLQQQQQAPYQNPTNSYQSSRHHVHHRLANHTDDVSVLACEEAYRRSHNSSRSKHQEYEPPLAEYDSTNEYSMFSVLWRNLAYLVTACIPNFLICRDEPRAKQAWREKILFLVLVLLTSLFVVVGLGFLPLYVCKEDSNWTEEEIWTKNGAWITVFGKIYDMEPFFNKHPGGSSVLTEFLGQDASKLFQRTPPQELPSLCLNLNKTDSIYKERDQCPELTEEDKLMGFHCHLGRGVSQIHDVLNEYEIGNFLVSPWELGADGMKWIQIRDKIYNVTQYIDGLRENVTNRVDQSSENPNAYLYEDLHALIVNKLNEDATDLYEKMFDTDEPLRCMHELFYMGLAGNPPNPICHQISVVMNALILGLLAITGIQVLCSLMFLARPHRLLNHEDLSVPVVVMLSCYNEGDKELRKTIDSILMTTYPSEDKVLVVIADGVITGKGESHSTPEILASILGFEYNGNDRTYDYMCLGAKFNRQNCIGVYAGTYEKFIGNEIKSLNYVVLVKRGTPEEQGTPRAGNRGKRDSQVVMLRMLNRFLHRRAPTSLDLAIAGEIAKFGHDILDMRYLLAVDADTRVDKDGIGHMVYTMERNKKIIACCGETQVDNKTQSWVTMVQVYEYFSSHHLKKAFESVFGSVTCLPGCFSMYRIFTEDEHALLACDPVLQEYSRNDITSLHERSLYELGEDRMLTTLLLKNFPGLRLDFVPEAICWTIVPHTFSMILSQRRRWINSTIHNLTELLRVRTLCGTCFFSMHMIVFLDMITTLILPATFAYLGYLVYLFIADRDSIDNFVLICIGINFGLQTLSFLLRSRWDFLLWFTIFVFLGIPVFYFILPIWAFLHMDEFSWGMTRQVDSKKKPSLGDKTEVTEEETNSTFFDGTDLEMNGKQCRTTSSGNANRSSCDRVYMQDATKNPEIAPVEHQEKPVQSNNLFCATGTIKSEDADCCPGGKTVLNKTKTTDSSTNAVETQPCSSMAPTSLTGEEAHNFEEVQLEI